jgi:amino acid permease
MKWDEIMKTIGKIVIVVGMFLFVGVCVGCLTYMCQTIDTFDSSLDKVLRVWDILISSSMGVIVLGMVLFLLGDKEQ